MPPGFAIGRPGQFGEFRRFCIQKLERASLVATDRAARAALVDLRAAFSAAGLGKLGNALGYGSDLQKGRGVQRFGAEGYRCSGWVFIKGKSDRTIGAIESYTVGAEIVPVNARWLWISTDEIPRFVGRKRMTPALYNSSGLVNSIGPLVQIKGRHNGESLLIVRNVTVDKFGRPGKAKALGRRIGPSRQHKSFIVAFVGIRRTSRVARLDPNQIVGAQRDRIPEYRDAAMGPGE